MKAQQPPPIGRNRESISREQQRDVARTRLPSARGKNRRKRKGNRQREKKGGIGRELGEERSEQRAEQTDGGKEGDREKGTARKGTAGRKQRRDQEEQRSCLLFHDQLRRLNKTALGPCETLIPVRLMPKALLLKGKTIPYNVIVP
jgi:hypothetical protein